MQSILEILRAIYAMFYMAINIIVGIYLALTTPFDYDKSYTSTDPSGKYILKIYYEDTSMAEPPGLISGLYSIETGKLIWRYQERYHRYIIPLDKRFAFSLREEASRTPWEFLTPKRVEYSTLRLFSFGREFYSLDFKEYCQKDWQGISLVEEVEEDKEKALLSVVLACEKQKIIVNLKTGVTEKVK